uniref:1-acyl-sn-glycerol-3-phosphate acyltransferase gamma n=1 Tax=Ficedula albicollis TaxID=59894 RepID=A0A803W2L8_FICAL
MGFIAFLKTQFIVHLLIGFVFVVSGLIINFIQLCTLLLWPLNKQLYRRVNCRLAYSLWSREYAGVGWEGFCLVLRTVSGLLLVFPQMVRHGFFQSTS